MKTIKLISVILILNLCYINGNAQDSINKQNNKNESGLPEFTGIDAGDKATVYITQGTTQSAKAEDDGVDFMVKDGILSISPNSKSFSKANEIYIVCTNLKSIKASGISKVKSISDIKGYELNIKATGASQMSLNLDLIGSVTTNMSGASSVTLKGSANTINANLSGASNLNANKLTTNNGNIVASGVSIAKVNVKDNLELTETGMGKIVNDTKPKNETIDDQSYIKLIKKEIAKKDSLIIIADSAIDGSDKVKIIYKTKCIKEKKNNEDGDFENDDELVKDGDVLNIDENNLTMAINPKKDKFKGHWAGFGLGFNGYVDKNFSNTLPKTPVNYDFLKLNTNKSISVDINFFNLSANLINNRFGLVSGVGLQYNNYRFGDNVVITPDSAQIYGYHNTNITSYIKSKLTISWLRVPLFIEYQTSKANHKRQFHIAAGGVFGYRIGSHSKQVYYVDGDKQKDKIYNDFYLNPIKLDAEVRIGWGPINLFASYAVTTLFQNNKGPELYPYIVGITLVGW